MYRGLVDLLIEIEGNFVALLNREAQRHLGLGLLGVGLVLLSYGLIWGSVDGFVEALDHDDRLFSDFRRFYYPMGEVLFSEEWPVAGYYYTSFFALGLSVVALLPSSPAVYVWGALQLVWVVSLFCVAGRWLLGLTGRGLVIFSLVITTSLPLLHNFKWGQVSVLMTLGILSAFALHRQGRSEYGGVVLALATCVKYYPGVFVVYFLIRRDWRLVFAFGLGSLAFYCLLPMIFIGPSGWWYFEWGAIQSLPASALLLNDFNTQYFPHVINRLGFPLGYRLSAVTVDLLRWLGLLVFITNSILIWWIQQRDLAYKTALSAAALLLSLPFIVQTSWPHYFVYLPFCQSALWLALAAAKIRIWVRRLLYAPIVFSAVLSSAYFFALLPNWRFYNGMGLLWLSDLALLGSWFGLCALGRKSDSSEHTLYIDGR